MTSLGAALLRALPMAFALPLPGLVPRAALALVFALCAVAGPVSAESRTWPVEAVRGLALGLSVAGPVWAARWAGAVVGRPLAGGGRRFDLAAWPELSGVLAWAIFAATGGLRALYVGYLTSDGTGTSGPAAFGGWF